MLAHLPDGWGIQSLRYGLIVREDGDTDIEAADMIELEAKVPNGHQLLSVLEA